MKQISKKAVIHILTFLSKRTLAKYKPKVIAVTGSVGKTSTKDAIYAALSSSVSVRKSEKSFNSEIGVPLTILGCPNAWNDPVLWLANIWRGVKLVLGRSEYPEWLVLEVGADRPGDIESLSSWLTSDIAVFTAFSKVPVHVEFFSSPEEVYREKAFLIDSLKEDGVLVYNKDDEEVVQAAEKWAGKKISFGAENPADFSAFGYEIVSRIEGDFEYPTGVSMEVDAGGEKVQIGVSGTCGGQIMYLGSAALAAASAAGVALGEAAKGLSDLVPPPGRMRIIPALKQATLVDDSYNSSPLALEEAMESVKAMPFAKRVILVLGDMLELGKYSVDEHKRLGEEAGKVADILVTVGVRARGFAEGALNAGLSEKNIFQYEDSQKAGKELELMLKPGDLVLVKGSQGVRMERVVKEIMAEPEKASMLLVRQDDEWSRR